MRKLECSPNVEVIGASVLSFVENVQSNEIHPYLEKYGLTDIDPHKWYPLQDWLNVINDMAEKENLSSTLVAIGMKIYQTIELPPEVENSTFAEILMGWDNAYQAQHRGGDVGEVLVEPLEDNHYKATINIPYPSDMIYGVAYGMGRRFLPDGTHFVVKYDPDSPRWEDGGDKTVLHITW